MQQVLGSSLGWRWSSLAGISDVSEFPGHPRLDVYRDGLKLRQPHFPRASRALQWLGEKHQLIQQLESPYVLFPLLFPPLRSPIHFNLRVLRSPFPERPACV